MTSDESGKHDVAGSEGNLCPKPMLNDPVQAWDLFSQNVVASVFDPYQAMIAGEKAVAGFIKFALKTLAASGTATISGP